MTSFERNSEKNDDLTGQPSLCVDLQAPINHIVSMAEILANTELDAEQRTFVSMISRSARALSSTVGDMVDLVQLDDGVLEIQMEPFNLLELLDDLDLIFTAHAREKSLKFDVDFQEGLPNVLIGDGKRLRQILSNLLSNAIKLTERGAVALRVSGEIVDGNAQLTIAVEDGVFNSTDYSENIIVDALIALMNGTIQSEKASENGRIVTIELSLPCVAENASRSVLVDHLQGVRVLFLATGSDENKAHIALLNEYGLDACLVADGMVANMFMQAAGKIRANVDVVLSELVLMQNYLKDAEPDDALTSYAKNRIIQIATASELSEADFASLQGYAVCLTEPVDSHDILEAISDALGKSEIGLDHASLIADPIVEITSVSKVDPEIVPALAPEENALEEPMRMEITPPPLAPTEERLAAPFDDVADDLLTFEIVSFEVEADAFQEKFEISPIEFEEQASERQLSVSHIDVLIAEDNEINQLVYRQILSKIDVTFKIVDSADDFFKEFETLNPKLVLLDTSLPDADGFEVAAKLRETDLAWGINVPIVGVVAPGKGEDHEACIAARMDDCLAKPISPNTLLEKIEYWLDRSANQFVA